MVDNNNEPDRKNVINLYRINSNVLEKLNAYRRCAYGLKGYKEDEAAALVAKSNIAIPVSPKEGTAYVYQSSR